MQQEGHSPPILDEDERSLPMVRDHRRQINRSGRREDYSVIHDEEIGVPIRGSRQHLRLIQEHLPCLLYDILQGNR